MFFVALFLTTTFASTFGNDIEDLMSAIETKNTVEVEKLLETADVKGIDHSGWNVLHNAAVNSNGEITRLLLSRGAREIVNDKVRFHNDVVTPLLLACYFHAVNPNSERAYEIMEALLMAGADPNAVNSNLNSPLHIVPTGTEARLLISYGANVDARNDRGSTPAYTIVDNKDVGFLQALVDGKADFTITTNDGDTILHTISMEFDLESRDEIWNKELILFLAQNGAPLESFNSLGETVLTQYLKNSRFFCSRSKRSNMNDDVRLNDSLYAYMAAAGANLNARNEYGETLLHLAASNFHVGMTKWLLKNGADVHAKNSRGDPPLSAFLKYQRMNYFLDENFYFRIKAVIDVLNEGGAIVDADDEEGREALMHFQKPRLTRSLSDWILGK